MRVFFWGPESAEIIAKLQSQCSDYSYSAVASWNELHSELGSDEFSVVVVDADDKPKELGQIVQQLQGQFSHCPLLLSSESLEEGPIAQIRQTVEGDSPGFLQRPYQVDEILQRLGQYHANLLADTPADMSKGGTESVDMEVAIEADLQQVVADLEAEGAKGAGKTEVLEKTKTTLENIDDEKQTFSLNEGGDDGGEGVVEMHTSSRVTVELTGEAEKTSSDIREDLDFGSDMFGVSGQSDSDQGEAEGGAEAGAAEKASLISLPAAPGEETEELSAQAMLGTGPVEEEQGEEVVEGVQEVSPPPPVLDASELQQESASIAKHHEDELLHLKASLESLREDREVLEKKLSEQERERDDWRYKYNGLQAEFHEAKIEIVFLKKRYDKDLEEFKYAAKLAQEKKDILSEKVKQLQRELEAARGRVAFDTRKIHQREKALESQLELLKVDSENLLKSRDKIILELKRKIDTLEFDFETVAEREKKAQEEKYLLEDRLERVTGVLRRTIGSLSDDLMEEEGGDPDKKLTEL